jgi:hypothetical protein
MARLSVVFLSVFEPVVLLPMASRVDQRSAPSSIVACSWAFQAQS